MKESFFEAKGVVREPKIAEPRESESVGFVERNRVFFDRYIGDRSIVFKSADGVQTPDGPLDTCAVDLSKDPPEVYLHDRFLSGEYGGSEPKMLFGTCHELEHIRELRELLREKDGARVWNDLQKKKESKKRYHVLDNSFDDVKMNRGVVARAPALSDTRRELYSKDLFPERDLTNLPKHLQFAHVLNCENQDTGVEWIVKPEVRVAINRLRAMKGRSGVPFLDYASHPTTPMSVRLRLQEAIIEPIYEKFFEEDVEKKRQETKNNEQGANNSQQSAMDDRQEPESDKSGAGNKNPKAGDQGEPIEGESKNGQPKAGDANGGESSPADVSDGEPRNPEEYFKKEYEDILKNFRRVISEEKINEAVKKEIERQAAEAKPGGDQSGKRAFEAYAQAQGVTPEDLRAYRRFLDTVEEIENPETNERVVDDLRKVFENIITRRKRPQLLPKYPLPEGDSLAYPAEAVVRTRAGEADPDVWEDAEYREKDDTLVGDFDVTVVGDVSGSMEGKKADAQRLAIALVLEALAEFSDELDDRRTELRHDLHVRTEGLVFGDGAECVKALSEELSEKERVATHKRLGNPNGSSTRDFLALEELLSGLSGEDIEKLEAGKLKKIVIVMTDGESDDSSRVQVALGKLREAGVIVVGIGILKEGKSALVTYAPEAKLCERIDDLPNILGGLLKEHLKTL